MCRSHFAHILYHFYIRFVSLFEKYPCYSDSVNKTGSRPKQGRPFLWGDCMKIKDMELGQIIPYENNPRHNDEAVELVANSIREFGWRVPIVVDKDMVIIAGHTRYKAAEMLGLKKVPVLVADDMTPEQVKAYRLADNKVAEKAAWDRELLSKELQLIMTDTEIDMGEFGFDVDLDVIDGDALSDIFIDKPDTEKKAKLITCPHCGEEFEL